MPLGQAIGIMSLGGYAMAILATLLLPETQGIALEAAGQTQTRGKLRAHATLGTPGDR